MHVYLKVENNFFFFPVSVVDIKLFGSPAFLFHNKKKRQKAS